VVEATPAQGVGQLARGVRGQDNIGHRLRRNGAELRNRDLEIGQKLEQEGFEFLVRPVYFVDQQDGRLVLGDGLEQGPFEQELPREDMALLLLGADLLAFPDFDRQDLPLVVPLVKRRAGIQALVAL
jgi:hypothetical protein